MERCCWPRTEDVGTEGWSLTVWDAVVHTCARLVITARNITGVMYAVCLSILENSNVQHRFSGDHTNYQSLEPDYWDQYNSTENKSCHMILGPLMYIPTTINVVK